MMDQSDTLRVEYADGEWHELESLLSEHRNMYRLLSREAVAVSKTKSRDKNRAYEYANLAATFEDALLLLRRGRHLH
jgi:hypothetical protein